MGKELIIKGADFSAHPVCKYSWVLDYREIESFIKASSHQYVSPFVPVDYKNLQGKIITKIRMIIKQAGTISIVKGTSLGSPFTKITEFNVTSSDVDTVKEFNVQISVGNNDIIGIYTLEDTGKFAYYKSEDNYRSADFYIKSDSSDYRLSDNGDCLGVSIYCKL